MPDKDWEGYDFKDAIIEDCDLSGIKITHAENFYIKPTAKLPTINKNKDKLVDDRNARHLLGAESAYHNIVKETYQIGNCILYYHWQCKKQISAIKCLITNRHHIFTKRQILKFATSVKCIISNGSERRRKCYAFQITASIKRILPNTCYACWNGYAF